VSFTVIIPARLASTRLPRKPLADIGGAPMVVRVAQRAESSGARQVAVAADSEEIAAACAQHGIACVLTSPEHPTGTDRIAEAATRLGLAAESVVVNVQGDEPLILPDAIDAAVAVLAERSDDRMSTLRRRIDDPEDLVTPSVVKVVTDADGYALYFSRHAIPYVGPGRPAPVAWRHLGLYVYRRDFLATLAALPQTPLELAEGLEQLRALEHGYRIRTVETTADAIGVDTPEDLERVRRLVETAART
jgi:3-deoxy-manno-octulosonate cytidylyltransferase (CMP-KDO synthetase)